LYVDNDALLLLPEFDKYYSSGIYFSYRRNLGADSFWFRKFNKNENIEKAIISYSFEHRFYTSKNIEDTFVGFIDRPYAGWVNFAVGLNYHYKNSSFFKVKFDLGILGPATKAEELQIWFHDKFNMKVPRGWEYQINNTLAANINLNYRKQIFISSNNNFEISTESALQAGTIRDNLRTGLAFRFGELGSFANSLFTKSNIGQERVKFKEIPIGERIQEVYFFYRISTEYVVHNTTIDGNFIGTESAFTKESKPWVLHQEFGVGRGGRLFDFLFSFHTRSKEIADNRKHHYFTIGINQRF
jgi:lipid A 3-O-deacylase